MIDVLNIWKTTLAKIPKVPDKSFGLNFAKWYFDRIKKIEPKPSVLTPVGFKFPFPTPLFANELEKLPPVPTSLAGITGFANAWEKAIKATVPVLQPGTVFGAPSPSTTFSAIASTVIDPASIVAGKAKLLELVTAPPVADATMSQFAVKFREATLLLTITVTGTNSDTPTPAPLTAPNVPLV